MKMNSGWFSGLRVCLLVVAGLVTSVWSEPDTAVFLCLGQSNMAGRAPWGAVDEPNDPQLLLLDSLAQWIPATNPVNRFSTIFTSISLQRLSPAMWFGRVLRDSMPSLTVGLVVNARGATSSSQWIPGTSYYDEAVARARAVPSGSLRGILWHQGEADFDNPSRYIDNIVTIVRGLRTDFGQSDLLFVAGEIGPVTSDGEEAINQMLHTLPDSLDNVAVVSAEGLTLRDDWHFDAPSVRILGARYANAVHPALFGEVDIADKTNTWSVRGSSALKESRYLLNGRPAPGGAGGPALLIEVEAGRKGLVQRPQPGSEGSVPGPCPR